MDSEKLHQSMIHLLIGHILHHFLGDRRIRGDAGKREARQLGKVERPAMEQSTSMWVDVDR